MTDKATLFMPTYNRREIALLAIENLFENTDPRLVRELVVVDCSSDDGLEEDLRRLAKAPVPWPVRVVTIPDRHVVAAMQKARTLVRGEYVAKVDSDTMVPPLWLDKLLDVVRRHPRLWALGMEARDAIEDLTAGAYGFNPAAFVGGIGLFRKAAWKGVVQTNATWFGWNEHQASRPWLKGWLKPSIRTFLLDYLPFEPFVSLQEHYFQKGWHRSRGAYKEVQEILWNWKYPRWRATRRADVLVLRRGEAVLAFETQEGEDSYVIESPDGARCSIPKEDVKALYRQVPGIDRLPDPEGRATKGFLAYGVDLRRHAPSGTWSFEGDAILGTAPNFRLPPGLDHGRLVLPGPVPDEYDLEAEVTRTEGGEDIGFGLVAGGRQFVFGFDAWGSWSGIFDVSGRPPNETYLGVQAPLFTNGKPRRIAFRLRRAALTVLVDGKLYWEWDADWQLVSTNPYHAVDVPEALFLTTYRSTFRIANLRISAPKED